MTKKSIGVGKISFCHFVNKPGHLFDDFNISLTDNELIHLLKELKKYRNNANLDARIEEILGNADYTMLDQIQEQYNTVCSSDLPADRKRVKIAKLIGEMQTYFDISLKTSGEKWNQLEPQVRDLYKQLLASFDAQEAIVKADQSLIGYNKRYEQIMAAPPSHERDVQLAHLMTDMEREFEIPMIRTTEWGARNTQNQKILEMYQKVSRSRS